jgi:hypothetical protein
MLLRRVVTHRSLTRAFSGAPAQKDVGKDLKGEKKRKKKKKKRKKKKKGKIRRLKADLSPSCHGSGDLRPQGSARRQMKGMFCGSWNFVFETKKREKKKQKKLY